MLIQRNLAEKKIIKGMECKHQSLECYFIHFILTIEHFLYNKHIILIYIHILIFTQTWRKESLVSH